MVTDEDFIEAVKNSKNISQILHKFNQAHSSSAYKVIKNRIGRLKLDISHFDKSRAKSNKYNYGSILINSDIKFRIIGKKLRKALIDSGREYKCEECSINLWQDKLIILQIHHIDGNWKNNLSDNLQFLCPNCHSQTTNYYNVAKEEKCDCGSKKSRISKSCRACNAKKSRVHTRKVERPSKEQLQKLVWEKPTTDIAKDFGITDKAIEKWCKLYTISKPPRGYWQKQKRLIAA